VNPETARTLALEAFLAEHQRCWRSSGKDLETWEEGPLVRVACPGCGALLSIPVAP